MRLHNPMGTAAVQARPVRLPTCTECGEMLLAPLLAEHVSPHLVHNHWVCESCGHTFRDSFTFADVEDEFVS